VVKEKDEEEKGKVNVVVACEMGQCKRNYL
jgi:hypothetical protein